MTNIGTIHQLTTEQENPRTKDIDKLPTLRMLELINDEDAAVAGAVRLVLPQVAKIVDACSERIRLGGRVLYVGAGTSGRLAYMDAAECPPTFGVDPKLFQVRMAGGRETVFSAQESVEDSREEGAEAIRGWGACERDCVIGIASSGRTPYVLSALDTAKKAGAFTSLLCANNAVCESADVTVCCITGPEALTGSTRMKAGTAAKMLLNMISTAVMIRCGRTYGNHMSQIRSSNGKLSSRLVITLQQCCGLREAEAMRFLTAADGSLSLALTAALSGSGVEAAKDALKDSGGAVREAIALLMKESTEKNV